MAEKGPGSTGRSQNKRLARAKIKPNDNGIKSSKGRSTPVEEEPSKAEKARERKKKFTAVAVGIFAVIMALSMTLPSLSYIFGNNDQTAAEEESAEQTSEETSEETEDTSDEQEDTAEATDMDKVDSNYHASIDPLEAKLKESPDDLATLLNLGNGYMSWAGSASAYASDDEGRAHVEELYTKAIEYFDKYLELNDSNAVKINRAMCQLYSGDVDGGTKALKKLSKDSPDYGPVWQYLGIVYEYYQGDTDAAKKAYKKAVEADADDEYGSKSYANQRLAAIAAQENGGDLTEEQTDTSSSTESTGAAALEDALNASK